MVFDPPVSTTGLLIGRPIHPPLASLVLGEVIDRPALVFGERSVGRAIHRAAGLPIGQRIPIEDGGCGFGIVGRVLDAAVVVVPDNGIAHLDILLFVGFQIHDGYAGYGRWRSADVERRGEICTAEVLEQFFVGFLIADEGLKLVHPLHGIGLDADSARAHCVRVWVDLYCVFGPRPSFPMLGLVNGNSAGREAKTCLGGGLRVGQRDRAEQVQTARE